MKPKIEQSGFVRNDENEAIEGETHENWTCF